MLGRVLIVAGSDSGGGAGIQANIKTVTERPRLDTVHTPGTGCTLASAIATAPAQGLALPRAVARALAYVYEAIRTAPALGKGWGPLNHAHTVRPFEMG